MSDLIDWLYWTSNALLAPVIVTLFLMLAYSVLQAGGLLAEALARRVRPRGHGNAASAEELKIAAERALLPAKLCARLGPMLGLAGTLIPLGPSLKAFAIGDSQALASGLIIAFSTTVVGLVIGGVNYAAYAIRRQWYSEDLHAATAGPSVPGSPNEDD